MVLTKGMPTRMGSLATDPDGPWTVDSPVAQNLREATQRIYKRFHDDVTERLDEMDETVTIFYEGLLSEEVLPRVSHLTPV